jgi:hypothetical protein
MRKFNIDAAKEGHEIVTKKGTIARILWFDRDNSRFPLVVLLENKDVYFYTIDGKFYTDKDSDKDLKLK